MSKQIIWVLCTSLFVACTQSSRAPVRAPDPPQVLSTDCSSLRMQLTLERKLRSGPTYELYITDQSGQPLAEGTRVILAFTSIGKTVSTTTVIAQPQGAGRYGPADGFTLSPGAWQLDVITRQASGTEAVCVFAFSV
jgi:hypothetical protein